MVDGLRHTMVHLDAPDKLAGDEIQASETSVLYINIDIKPWNRYKHIHVCIHFSFGTESV
jgi:hypothetical protein